MVTTTYKGYELIVTGAEVGTWGAKLNTDDFTFIDQNLGGLVSKSLTNVNVTLTTSENRNLILRLSGTLTGTVQIITTLQGMMMVENLTTGAFAVTFSNGVGTPITLPQGFRTLVIADTTNGPRSMGDNQPEFPSGTKMLFYQASAPTGWTKDTNAGLNHAVRIVGGSGGGVTGGSVAFTTAFASQGVSGTVGNTALTVAQLPPHTHGYHRVNLGGAHPTGTGRTDGASEFDTTTDSTGNGDTHTHSFTGNAINLAVQYLDVIVCTKN